MNELANDAAGYPLMWCAVIAALGYMSLVTKLRFARWHLRRKPRVDDVAQTVEILRALGLNPQRPADRLGDAIRHRRHPPSIEAPKDDG